jgi:hypothetical protein
MAEEVTATEAIGEASLALNELSSRYWQFLRYEFPFNALTAGQPLDEPTLFREAPSDFARRADVARIFHAELQNISLSSLSQKDRITYRLLERELSDLQDVFATDSHLRPWLLPAGPEFNTQYLSLIHI